VIWCSKNEKVETLNSFHIGALSLICIMTIVIPATSLLDCVGHLPHWNSPSIECFNGTSRSWRQNNVVNCFDPSGSSLSIPATSVLWKNLSDTFDEASAFRPKIYLSTYSITSPRPRSRESFWVLAHGRSTLLNVQNGVCTQNKKKKMKINKKSLKKKNPKFSKKNLKILKTSKISKNYIAFPQLFDS